MRIRAQAYKCIMVLLVILGLTASTKLVAAIAEVPPKKVAILPFSVPHANASRDWLGSGFPYVLALRLQQSAAVKVSVLSRVQLAMTDAPAAPLEGIDAAAIAEELRAQGYEGIVLGAFHQVESTLRLEVHVWTLRPERQSGKVIEQTPERDPDGLASKIASFVLTALPIPVSEAEGRRVGERYTGSAEAFERFARALPLADVSGTSPDVSQAVTLLQEAVNLDGKFFMALRQLADLQLRQGDYDSAAKAYQALLAMGKRSVQVYRLLGSAFMAQRDSTRAIDAYRRGLQLDNRHAQLYLDLGLAHTVNKDYENATKALLRVLEVKPDDALAFANLGVVYLLQGNFPAATASLRRAQLSHGTDARLTYNLGLSLMFEGAYDQARDQFERALQLQPNYASAAYQLALLYEQSDRARAIQRWRQYLELAEGQSSEQRWLKVAVERLKRLENP